MPECPECGEEMNATMNIVRTWECPSCSHSEKVVQN